MAVKHTQIAELITIVVRNVGRARYETVLKELKTSQAYKRNQSFHETIERMERSLKTGRSKPPKPPKTPSAQPPKAQVRGGRSSPRG